MRKSYVSSVQKCISYKILMTEHDIQNGNQHVLEKNIKKLYFKGHKS